MFLVPSPVEVSLEIPGANKSARMEIFAKILNHLGGNVEIESIARKPEAAAHRASPAIVGLLYTHASWCGRTRAKMTTYFLRRWGAEIKAMICDQIQKKVSVT
jgi:hypothetical protein